MWPAMPHVILCTGALAVPAHIVPQSVQALHSAGSTLVPLNPPFIHLASLSRHDSLHWLLFPELSANMSVDLIHFKNGCLYKCMFPLFLHEGGSLGVRWLSTILFSFCCFSVLFPSVSQIYPPPPPPPYGSTNLNESWGIIPTDCSVNLFWRAYTRGSP